MSDKRTVEILYGHTGAIVETYPDEALEGIPSAASVSIYRGDQSMDEAAEFTASVTIDPTSTTVDVASGYSQTNRRLLYIAATSDMANGRQYLLANAFAQREIVTPRGLASADYATLEKDLLYDYAITSSTLKGIRMVFTVDATWVATESKILSPFAPSYKALWSYTLNSISRRQATYIRLVRQYFKAGVDLRDLEEYWPDLSNEQYSEQHGEAFTRVIDGALDAVRVDIKVAGHEPTIIRDTEIIHQLCRFRALLSLGEMGLAPGSRDVELYITERRTAYTNLLNAAIASALKVDVDQGTEGAVTPNPIQQLFFER